MKAYIMGNYTSKAFQGFLKDPASDRKAVVKQLTEAMGGQMHSMDIVRGSFDFISVCEGTFEQMAAAKMVAASSGSVGNIIILESADLNKIAATAKKMSSGFKAPGK